MPRKVLKILAMAAVAMGTVTLCAVVSIAEPPKRASGLGEWSDQQSLGKQTPSATGLSAPDRQHRHNVASRESSSTILGKSPSESPDGLMKAGSAGELIGFSGFTGSGSQTITLVHTGKMQMAVYHIDRSGRIHLVSSRPIEADFSLTLNPTAPLPDEIRKLRSDRSRSQR